MRIILTMLCLLAPVAAFADRIALVLGNADYRHTTPLPNAATDAADMAKRLADMGFSVHTGLNQTRAQTLALVETFAADVSPDDLALFYYAGHGAQIGTENYIIPVDAQPLDEPALSAASVRLQAILRTMELRADRRIVILDACRNNPFLAALPSRAAADAPKGLARVEAGVGSYIAFSTQPGNVALDGAGRNSPFTAALLTHITSSDDIHAVMRRVRADVVAATGQAQVPWENSSLVDAVFLTDTTSAPIDAPAATPSGQAPIQADETGHYVGGLDPGGDGFLALRDAPSAAAQRLAELPDGTPLTVLQKGGLWWQVRLQDGRQGFAHSAWIKCCTPTLPATTPARSETTCDALWHARNQIWHDAGLCFTTRRAIRTFGNTGCKRGLARADIPLSAAARAEVSRLAAAERRMGCNAAPTAPAAP